MLKKNLNFIMATEDPRSIELAPPIESKIYFFLTKLMHTFLHKTKQSINPQKAGLIQVR